jgi:hypothetical protein
MRLISTLVVATGLLLVLTAMVAVGQTAPLMTAGPVASASASGGKWTCAWRMTIELAPVSFDTLGQAEAWVIVHRVKGEIIAAERISARGAEQIRRLPCPTANGEAGSPRIG